MYVCMYMFIYMFICMFIYIYIYICIHICIHVFVYSCVYVFVCVSVCLCVHCRRSSTGTLARLAGRSIALSSSDSSSDSSKPSDVSAGLRTHATQLFKRQMPDLSSCAARNPSLQLLECETFGSLSRCHSSHALSLSRSGTVVLFFFNTSDLHAQAQADSRLKSHVSATTHR